MAIRPHAFAATFGEPCEAPPCRGAQLGAPGAIAVGEASGEVYVVDRGVLGDSRTGRIVRFAADGGFLSEFAGTSAKGSGVLTAGSSSVESVLTEKGQFIAGQAISAPGLAPGTKVSAVGASSLELSQPASASELGLLEAGQSFEAPGPIAVDNSCALRKAGDPGLTQQQCEEDDPSNGDVYVVDRELFAIDKYSAAGEFLGQIDEGEGGRFSRPLEGVAVDEEGGLLVYLENFTISRYTNEAHNSFVPPSTPLSLECCAVTAGLALDRGGQLYLLRGIGEASTGRVAKVGREGATLIEALGGTNSAGVAVDQANGNPLVAEPTSLAVFDPEGQLVERLGEEQAVPHLAPLAGVGVNAATSTFYAAGADGHIAAFGLAPPTVPEVENESFSQVSSSSAKLAATINPRSEVGEGPTGYRFEYGRCTSLAACPTSPYEAVAGSGLVEADFESHDVGAEATGLQPGSAYHFRVMAENSRGMGAGEAERAFITQPADRPLSLPDERSWELVSPAQKLGGLIEPLAKRGLAQAAGDGLAVSYLSKAPTEAQPAGYSNKVQVLSRRGPEGWSSRDIALPHSSATGLSLGAGSEYEFFDTELSASVVQPFGEFVPQLSEEASESTAYLHLTEDCAARCFRPLVTGKAGFADVPAGTQFGEEEACRPKAGQLAERLACGPEFVDATDDLRHVVLHAGAELEPGAGPLGLYEWSDGALEQVNLLPRGAPAPGAFIGLQDQSARGALSRDGSRVVWESPGATSALYMRDLARRETVELDGADPCTGCESGGGQFQAASADGSRVLFTDTHKLTATASAEPGARGGNLYECAIVLVARRLRCELRDLTPRVGEEGAAVQEAVLGASEDGSYVYFVADGVQSTAPNGLGRHAIPGTPNLYLHHGSHNTFVATLDKGDLHDWQQTLSGQPTRVSPNGRWLEFMSQAGPTGYDNRDVASGRPVAEVYLYDASANRVACASCLPSGARPVGIEYKALSVAGGGLVGGDELWPSQALVGANVPGWTNVGSSFGSRARYQPRYLSDDGRLFFDTLDELVPQDRNETQDVYEYEPPGLGSCLESSDTFSVRSGGCVALISSGRAGPESAFLDASESGDDAFFLTSAQLSGVDGDSARDVYDARRCSEQLPCLAPPPQSAQPCSSEESCKAPPAPPASIFASPLSALAQEGESLIPGKARPKTPAELRARRLAKALAACGKLKRRQRRLACRRRARRRFGTRSFTRGRVPQRRTAGR